ncbi:MAG: hypothetical protein R2911_14005 [Caldilineaceae bacterium]
MPSLKPKYVALLAKRYVLDRPSLGIVEPRTERSVYPDVHVWCGRRRTLAAAVAGKPGVVLTEPTPIVPSLMLEEILPT